MEQRYYSQQNRRGGGGNFRGRSRYNRPAQGMDYSKFIRKASELPPETVEKATHRFSDFKIDSGLLNNILSKGYEIPTPIQDKSIEPLLEGRDLVGLANTGTGKTAAFLIPMIDKVLRNRRQKVLIVTPTRELAFQIEEQFKLFSRGLGLFSISCIGGTSIGKQIAALRRQTHFVIGTPGRLKDLIQRGFLNLSQFESVVLDEVDRMFDMGFVHEIRLLLSQMPENRQSLFFSATLSREIENLMQDFLKNPVKISCKSRETAANVDQDIIKTRSSQQKMEVLDELLKKSEFKKVLIFGRTKWGVHQLSQSLNQKGFKTESIHGDKTQSGRQQSLQLFKNNHVNVLVATDVASRGLDIPDVTHVINFDLPDNYDDYIHRIGRTGRANKKGIALTFVN